MYKKHFCLPQSSVKWVARRTLLVYKCCDVKEQKEIAKSNEINDRIPVKAFSKRKSSHYTHRATIYVSTKYTLVETPSMTKVTLSLRTLPVELVYRILGHCNNSTRFCSTRNICTRINAIVDSYHRYQVNYFACFILEIFIIHRTLFITTIYHISSMFSLHYWILCS